MTTYLLRGAYANEFELQNYESIVKEGDPTVITSHHPLTSISLPTLPLWSPADLPNFPYKRQMLNRLVGGEHWLLGLEKIIPPGSMVHTAETYYPYTHQAVKLRKKGIIKKLICTCWETIPHANEKFAQLRMWKQEAYKYVDLFHAPTQKAKQALIAEGVEAAKILVIPYGVNLTRFHPVKHKENPRPIVLCVARPVKEKGINIFHTLAEMFGDLAEFRFVSDAQYKEMPGIYQSADIFFLPSQSTKTWEEQYGMVLVEAMASGLPIVTTNCGAIPEVVGDKALVVEQGNIGEMQKALSLLIKDHELRSKMGKSARTRAERLYDSRAVAQSLLQLY